MGRELSFTEKIAQDILTERRKALWRPFMRAIRTYELIRPGDRIAVCVSGGKDSMLMAVLFRQLQRQGEIPFEAVYLIMDPGYNADVRAQVEQNARLLELPYVLRETDVFEASGSQDAHPCFLCARMRRGCLYRLAEELGCNKIALGHHFDDVVETTVMAMLYGGQLQGMPPKLRAKNFPGMELIRPLYGIREADIVAWRDAYGLSFIQCACPFTDAVASKPEENLSKRQYVKALLKQIYADNPKVYHNVFNSIHKVQLDTLVGWKYLGEEHRFLDDYDG